MKKLNLFITFAILTLGSCSAQKKIVFKELTQEKRSELKINKTVKCAQYIDGTMKYKKIDDIEKRKLNKLKREAMKCNCNTVYLDFGDFLEAAYEGDNLFYAVCVNE